MIYVNASGELVVKLAEFKHFDLGKVMRSVSQPYPKRRRVPSHNLKGAKKR